LSGARTRREFRPLAISVYLLNRNPEPPTAFSWIPVPVASDEREIEPQAQFHFGTALAVHLEVLVRYLPYPMTRFLLNASSSDRVN